MTQLTNKSALVTGAGRGIGRGIAVALARAGADICICSRTEADVADVADEIARLGRQALPVVADISLETDVDRLFARARKQFGTLDLLVNNAGAFDGGPLDELSIAAWDTVIATNLRGPFLCTRAALQWMKPQRRGRILNIGSISAHRVRPGSAAYSASKHGLWGLTQVTALEGREFGVTCGCIQPGNTLVERRAASDNPEDEEPMMSIEDLAQIVVAAASLSDGVSLLEATVLPSKQLYVGRG
ncbi:MAG: SDR family oxidoreductase [Planctomycetales bacterium]|nr:SDR family oxidoreductase [Planctomycetales bacterium]